MQHEITKAGRLLDEKGNIAEAGWSREPLLDYRRGDIRAPRFRIKEWDYYLVCDGKCGTALTVADNGYMGLLSVSALDFTRAVEHTASVMTAFPMGSFHMPESSLSGDVRFSNKRISISFEKEGGLRKLDCTFRAFHNKEDLRLSIRLQEAGHESITIATPFHKSRHFYYNRKLNCMRAEGSLFFGDKSYTFSPDDSFGTLDWGRGVWTYDNIWYWGSASGTLADKPFGFNIGYGFGDCSAASENILFYGGIGHKLTDIRFHIPAEGYTKPWTFSSADGRFEMDFRPVLDRANRINALLVESDQHQVFGHFSGRAVLDGGEVLELRDFFGFAEKVHNRY